MKRSAASTSLPTRPCRPRLADVAQMSGVAVSTVSAILRDEPTCYAASDTRRRVRRAAEFLGYQPNPLARALRHQQTNTIGIAVPAFTGPRTYTQRLDDLENCAREAGFRLSVGAHRDDPRHELLYLQDFVASCVAGAVVYRPSPQVLPRWRAAADAGLPVVVMDADADMAGMAGLALDRRRAGRLVVEHLLGQGRRRLAFAIGASEAPAVVARVQGYREAMDEAGLPWPTDRVARSPEGGAVAIGMRLASRLVRPGVVFDAVVASSDVIAAGVMRVFRDRGVSVPRDVAVAGFDDDDYCEALEVPLTSVRQPRDMGFRAFHMLHDQIVRRRSGKAPPPFHVSVLLPQLIVRQSTSGVGCGPSTGRCRP